MPAASLLSMAQQACIRNLANITDVSDIPYDLLRPVLRKIDNPQRLHDLETKSPHLADHSAELWRAFIARDIPDWQAKIIEPKNPHSWWKVYRKLVREEQRRKEAQEEVLREAMSGLDKEKEAHRAKFVSKVIPQHSRGRAFVDGVPNPSANTWGQVRTPALQNAKKGKDIMAALRKQGTEAQLERGLGGTRQGFGQPARIMVPSSRAQIKKAPESMLMDHRKPAVLAPARVDSPAARKPHSVFAPKKGPTAQERALNDALRERNADREKRLLALTNPRAKVKAVPGASDRPLMNAGSPASATSPGATSRTPTAASPPSAISPPPKEANPTSVTPKTARLAVDSMSSQRSPSPLPQVVRKRPAPTASVFMPTKKKKI